MSWKELAPTATARHNRDADILVTAAHLLENQEILMAIARHDKDETVRGKAVQKK